MLKEMEYKEKFELLDDWLAEVLAVVRSDLKKEHLKIDKQFCKRYFLGKNYAQVTVEEMVPAYRQEIKEGNEGLGEFIATRWLLKNTDIYNLFEEKLKPVTPDFDELEELPEELAQELIEQSLHTYGPTRTYLFSVFNSVVFKPEVYETLQKAAVKETATMRQKSAAKEEAETLEKVKKRYEREFAALNDRYEKKMRGMEKKYLRDTEMLKKQLNKANER